MSIFGSINNILNQINKVLDPIMKSQGFQGLGTVTITGRQDESEKRNPFPQFNPFRSFVMLELLRRKKQFPTMPATPFVRMTSTNVDPNAGYQFFSLGLHGFDVKEQNIFDLTYSTDGNDVVGTAISTSSKNRRTVTTNEISAGPEGSQALEQFQHSIVPDARPMPGITAVSVKRSGLGQPMIATIQWVCYNRSQLEFLRNHFLIPGQYIVLEIGQNFADQPVQKLFDFERDENDVFEELAVIIGATNGKLADLRGREIVINTYTKPNKGNYDVIVGQVGNFGIEFEPQSNIYKCTTSLVSQGENVWGIKLEQTSVSLEKHKPGEITNIKDYFLNGLYDAYINKELAFDSKLATAGSNGVMKEPNSILAAGSEELKTAAQANNVSVNAADYVYFTWDKIFGTHRSLLTDMLGVIKDEGIHAQLVEMLQLNNLGTDEKAGYHSMLLSCEPESLLLINKANEAYFPPNESGDSPNSKTEELVKTAKEVYKTNGEFGPEDDDGAFEAKLKHGVWINSGMIRECFVGAADLKQAISSVLMCLNRATSNYWQLQLYYDDETGKYKIIDYKAGDQAREQSFYRFNVGPGVKSIMGDVTNGGECLSVEFDSAFPPELISQMMLMAKFHAADGKEQLELIKKYPLIGSTSAHTFVLNWSNLRDGLSDYITKWRNGQRKDTTTGDMTAGASDAVSRQITGPAGPSSVDATRAAAAKAGDTTPTPVSGSNPETVKTETKPVPNAYKLTRAPVAGTMKISSGFGKRINPVTQSPGEAHNGVDIVVDSGTSVYNTVAGIAYRVQSDHPGYGNVVYIRHLGGDGMESLYAHLSQINVKQGDFIHNNTVIGLSGGALTDPGHGSSTGAHLHYEMRLNEVPYNQVLRSLDNVGTLVAANASAQVSIDNINSVAAVDALQDSPTVSTPDNPTGELLSSAEMAVKAAELRRAEVTAKFGSNIWALTEMNRGDMINRITLHGYNNDTIPNSYVSPYPTTTSCGVEIMGIAGISISDGFFVDRIPFTFEQHGVFQVVEVTDEVGPSGWRTKVRGYFKMLWYDANGQSTAIF